MEIDLIGETQQVPINTTGTGDKLIKAIDPGQRFVVMGIYLTFSGASNITVKSGSTAISGVMPVTATTEWNLGFMGSPVFKGDATGDNLIINSSGAINMTGHLQLIVAAQ
jgi:hypothetical protein